MKHIKLFEQFIEEAASEYEAFYTNKTKEGKKPEIVFNLHNLDYDELEMVVDPKWGRISLPNPNNHGSEDYTIFLSQHSDSAREKRYRKRFEDWKQQTLKEWGKGVKIFVWDNYMNKLMFRFMPGSSKILDKEMKRRIENAPGDIAFTGPGRKGRYQGD